MNLDLIFEVLRELANADYQAALWTGQVEGEHSSFTEAVCVLFDDAGLARAIDSRTLEKMYSKALYECALELRTLVALIDDTGTPEQTLNHPKLDTLREVAFKLHNLFVAET